MLVLPVTTTYWSPHLSMVRRKSTFQGPHLSMVRSRSTRGRPVAHLRPLRGVTDLSVMPSMVGAAPQQLVSKVELLTSTQVMEFVH